MSVDDRSELKAETKDAGAPVENEVVRLRREVAQLRHQQTATAEVLKTISRAAIDLQQVLDTLVATASRLCNAPMVAIHVLHGDQLPGRARFGFTPEMIARVMALTQSYGRGSLTGRIMLEGKAVHIADTLNDPEYTFHEFTQATDARSMLGVPLISAGTPRGLLLLYRPTPEPFSPGEIELMETFADKAVIAIENARLFAELTDRKHELQQALEFETANSEVLQIISGSPSDLSAVYDKMLASALRYCEASSGALSVLDSGAFRTVANVNIPESLRQSQARMPLAAIPSMLGMLKNGQPLHIEDLREWEVFRAGAPFAVETVKAGARSAMLVPLLREGKVIGIFAVYRPEVRKFTDKQIALVTSFARQAVIAIENARLFEAEQTRSKELTESFEYQSATSEVLDIISRSPTDAQPVFERMVASAARLCDAVFSTVWLYDGELLHYAAGHNSTPAVVEHLRKAYPKKADRSVAAGRAILDGRVVQVADTLSDPDYAHELALAGNWRSILAVPMLRGGKAIGAIAIGKAVAEPFSERQLQLASTFANQAVIAIENARLFEAEQTRTKELQESLEYQTATSEVLSVISRSPSDLRPVLESIAVTASQLCGTDDVGILLRENGYLRFTINRGSMAPLSERLPLGRDWVSGRAVIDGVPVHVRDLQAEAVEFPRGHEIAMRHGHRTALGIPLLRDGEAIGCIFLRHTVVRPFTDRQIALLRIFADQAVIAINNVNLFDEVQTRTRELTESLEYQTAMADVLGVMSRSQFALEPVLQSVVDTAARLCHADKAIVYRASGDAFRYVAGYGKNTPAYLEIEKTTPIEPGTGTLVGRTALARTHVQIADALGDPAYEKKGDARIGQLRTMLGVPLLRDGEVIGIIALGREVIRPFEAREISLVETFADQAVIAMENARLVGELQTRQRELEGRSKELTESLEYQTAISTVLNVISRTQGNVQPVLDVIVSTAKELCEADRSSFWRLEGDRLELAAHKDHFPGHAGYLASHPVPNDRTSLAGRVIAEKRLIHIDDRLSDRSEIPANDQARSMQARTMLGVPLLLDGQSIGSLSLVRNVVRPFSKRQIMLVQTFADQAVIAIENARLFEAEKTRTKELQESLEYQTAISDVLGVISRSPSEVRPVLDTIADTARRLCEAEYTHLAMRESDGLYHIVPNESVSPSFLSWVRSHPITAGDGSMIGIVAADKRARHFPDALAEPRFTDLVRQEQSKARTMLGVPLLRGGEVAGVIFLARTRVQPFTDRQIALVTTFADQAVIAIENARLFEAEQTRTKELTESLEYQTAISDVLAVISTSPSTIAPVFDTIVATARKLCHGDRAMLRRKAGDVYPVVASSGLDPQQRDRLERYPTKPDRGTLFGRAVVEEATIHLPDIMADPGFTRADAPAALGVRSGVSVPLLHGGDVIGVLTVTRQTPGPFEQRQIQLLETFARQAIIAIQNTRLFEAEQTRSKELQESLDRQTATAQVLGVISRAPNEVQPVLDTIVTTARALCQAERAIIWRLDAETFSPVAHDGLPDARVEAVKNQRYAANRTSMVGRAVIGRRAVQVADVLADRELASNHAFLEAGNVRAVLATPLLSKGAPIGAITVSRTSTGLFDEKLVGLVESFADQAVIAIENARLFEAEQTRTKELTESLEYQTATSEVLGVISKSPNDLQPVLDAITETAARLCDAEYSHFRLLRDGAYHVAADHGYQASDVPGLDAGVDALRKRVANHTPIRPGHDSVAGRAALECRAVHIENIMDDPTGAYSKAIDATPRTVLGVPLVKGGVAVGVIMLFRRRVQPFTERQMSLVNTFAEQALIAMENTRLFEEVQARTKELAESLEYQTAISQVLSVISRSPNEIQAVLDAIARTVTRLCGADAGLIWRAKQSSPEMEVAAHCNLTAERLAFLAHHPIGPANPNIPFRAMEQRQTLHVHDVRAHPEFSKLSINQSGRQRTQLCVPLLNEGRALGVISLLRRDEVRPFSARQIALVETFADQAVIAIENARLFEAEQTRTKELTESLEYQTAISAVLGVISRSPDKLQPVLDVVVENAARVCGAESARIFRPTDNLLWTVARYGDEGGDGPTLLRRGMPIVRGNISGRAFLDRRTIHVEDLAAEIDSEYPESKAFQEAVGHRTTLVTPLLRDGESLGVIATRRFEVKPFTSQQINLLETFANQAVIAINNVGLFEEVQARTKELQESLEYQTATSEVLGVISRSPNELQPVLDAIAETAQRLCAADRAIIWRRCDNKLTIAAQANVDPGYIAYLQENPYPLGQTARASLAGEILHVRDMMTDPDYAGLAQVQRWKPRTMLSVPLRRDGCTVGLISLVREEVDPFTQRQIGLITTFADQAVIAINNVGLFEEVQARTKELEARSAELQESLQYQTANSDVLEVISRSPTEMMPVLQTIANTAADICNTQMVAIFLREDDAYKLYVSHGLNDEYLEIETRGRFRPGDGSLIGRVALSGITQHVADSQADAEYALKEDARAGRIRTMLGVPLVRFGEVVGVICLARQHVEPFDDKQVQIVTTFASQAVIAINNVRLFNEITEKSEQLRIASQHKSQFLANMSHELRTPLNAILGYTELLVDGTYGALAERPKGVLERVERNGRHLLGLINDVLDLSKIEAGEMSLAIEEYSWASLVRNVVAATEPLARQKGLTLETDIGERLPRGTGDSRRLNQVLLNLVGNAIKFTDKGTVRIAARADDDRFHIAVTDSGPGIAAEDQARIFETFQQIDNSSTRKKGGSGLGLSISKELIELQGGTITVTSVVGQGSTFEIVLPCHVTSPSEASA